MATINSVNTSPVQYNVQVGGTNGTTANVSPSTAGFILTSNGASANPSFQAPASSSISITGDSGGALTGSAFVFAGGSTGLSFDGTTGPNTITLSGILDVPSGGTGAISLTGVLTGNGVGPVTANAVTEHAVLLAGASNAVTDLGVATDGQLIIGSTGADPVLAELTSTGGTIVITNGAGSINLEADETIAVTYTEDSGTATPAAGNLNVVGDSLNINTDGTGDTITISLENAITLGSSPISPGNPALTATTGDIVVTAGSIKMPYINPSFGLEGAIFVDAVRALYGVDGSNWFLAGGGNIGLDGDTSNSNIGIGSGALSALLGNSLGNIALGSSSLNSYVGNGTPSQGWNVALGDSTGMNLLSGTGNVLLGINAGNNYVGSESTNILIVNNGVASESGAIRIGANGAHTSCYIAGIDGVNVGSSTVRVVSEASDKLGTVDITAGSGIAITPGANSITISATAAAFGWTEVTGTSQSLAVQNGYVTNNGSLVTLTMPTSAAIGDIIEVVGKGAGGWTVVYTTGQSIKFGNIATTTTTGSLASTNANDSIKLVCTTASGSAPIFTVTSSVGNITYV